MYWFTSVFFYELFITKTLVLIFFVLPYVSNYKTHGTIESSKVVFCLYMLTWSVALLSKFVYLLSSLVARCLCYNLISVTAFFLALNVTGHIGDCSFRSVRYPH